MKVRHHIWVAVFLCALSIRGFAQGPSAMNSDWESAARNRDHAAQFQSAQAMALLTAADDKRTDEFAEEAERRKHFTLAGDMEFNAGVLFWAASANFTKAAGNWEKSAQQYARADASQWVLDTNLKKEESLASAQHAQHLAAQAYERAVDAYGLDNAATLAKAGAASEKAAECREAIAKSQ